MGDDAKYHLVICAIPLWRESHFYQPVKVEGVHGVCANAEADRGQYPMLRAVSELVKFPDKWVPSLVWLERPKKLQNVIWQVPASSSPDNVCVDAGVSICDGEESAFKPGVPGGKRCCEPALVKGGSQPLGDLVGQGKQLVWDACSEFDLMSFVSRYVVFFDNSSVWLGIEKTPDASVQNIDMVLCGGYSALRVIEDV